MQLPEAPAAAAVQQFDIAIIGAGFSGSMLAVHLMSGADSPMVALIEKSRSFGPGIAYGIVSPEHLLNVPAGKMSAFPDRPEHFLRWVRQRPKLAAEFGMTEFEPTAFFPRGLYGRYLAAQVQDAVKRSGGLRLVDGDALDLERDEQGRYLITLGDGSQLRADQVVLAWGNLPPAVPFKVESAEGEPLLRNPWGPGTRELLAAEGELLIIGTGLTCLDLLATANKHGRPGRIHVLSRHGLFPQAHRPTPPRPPFLDGKNLPKTMRTLFRACREELRRAEAEGSDWRAVVDSLRPHTQELWRRLPAEERRRFLRHVRPLWETLRHRAAPAMRAAKDALEASGKLVRHRGRVEQVRPHPEGVEVIFQPRGSREMRSLCVRAVINATGPETDLRRIQSPFVQNLLRRGLVRRDPLGLGIETTDGQAEDSVHAVGSLRKGALWESTAVPELREQAVELSRRLLAARQTFLERNSRDAAGLGAPGHLWIFEI